VSARTPSDGPWRFSVAELPSEVWRNGGGVTRTVASNAREGAEDWTWRASIADITQDVAFSLFPGVERQLVLIDGRRLVLRGLAEPLRLERVGERVQFPGEERLMAELNDGPVRVWNVMTRRGAAACTLRISSAATTGLPGATRGVETLLLVLEGSQQLLTPGARDIHLQRGEGVWLSNGLQRHQVHASSAGSTLLVTSLHAT
jgi:environmental stress-induced protein Ves